MTQLVREDPGEFRGVVAERHQPDIAADEAGAVGVRVHVRAGADGQVEFEIAFVRARDASQDLAEDLLARPVDLRLVEIPAVRTVVIWFRYWLRTYWSCEA